MGSGLDLSCLTYEKVAAFVAAANKELNSACSPFNNHPLRRFLEPLLERAGEIDVEGTVCVVNISEIDEESLYLFASVGDADDIATNNVLVYDNPASASNTISAGTRVNLSIATILDALRARQEAGQTVSLSEAVNFRFVACENDYVALAALYDDVFSLYSTELTALQTAQTALAAAETALAALLADPTSDQADIDAAVLVVSAAETALETAQENYDTAFADALVSSEMASLTAAINDNDQNLVNQWRNWLSFRLVEDFLLASDTGLSSAADIDNIHWIIYNYLINMGSNYPLREAGEFVCQLENIKFVNGTSVDKNCEFLFAARPFRILAGALVSLVGKDGSCWGAPCKVAYRIVRARWTEVDVCRSTLERCEYVAPGVYRALLCKTLFGADEFLDGAALAAITSNEITPVPEE